MPMACISTTGSDSSRDQCRDGRPAGRLTPPTYLYCVTKRLIDVAAGSLAWVLAAPVLLLAALAIRVTMGRPVLYRQTRTGMGGRRFTLLKLRTMRTVSAGVPDEDRLTTLGWFLRATSIDELPQLWNVLRGDMSLVGPRPLLPQYLGRYSAEQNRRHDVKPGITGLAQVCGRNSLSWEDKFRLDVWYVDHQTVTLDLRILLRTLIAVMKRRGVAAPGYATMPEFLGDPHKGAA
jgi:lipopolysaccharide/colanic/teichoic acid biosynthesis glycosyltransferase